MANPKKREALLEKVAALDAAQIEELAEYLRSRFGIDADSVPCSDPRSRVPRDRRIPKVPVILQRPIDALIAKGKRDGLTEQERQELESALDYLDDLTLAALSRG